MRIREPVVAGSFYEADPRRCRADVIELSARALEREKKQAKIGKRPVGGLVPHAGWAFSGAVAGKVFAALASARSPDVLVLFGAFHRRRRRQAAIFGSGRWETPLGSVEVDARLAERILGNTSLIVDDPYAHEDEHSLEVQMPFVKHLFPEAKVVPIMVPAVSAAHEVGNAVGRTISSYGYDALVIGTTDLTHYGPGYGFTPHGIGPKGNTWAREVNDRGFIDLVCALKSAEVVAEAARHNSACGSGAVAATLAAVGSFGATTGQLLSHTTSAEVLPTDLPGEQNDSVGYAGIVLS